MRSHCALYVDAGYLLAAAATRRTGTSLRRGIVVNYEHLVRSLTHHVRTSGLPLLRVHWYDSARHGVPDSTQERIALLPGVKVRLGRIGFDGEQKGVDLRIGLDMVGHARNNAVDVMYLVSGDDDLTEAVEEVQAHGVQVILLAIPNDKGAPHSVSRHLQQAADGLELLDADAVDAAVTPSVRETPAALIAATQARMSRDVAEGEAPAEAADIAQRQPAGPVPGPPGRPAPTAPPAPPAPPAPITPGEPPDSSTPAGPAACRPLQRTTAVRRTSVPRSSGRS